MPQTKRAAAAAAAASRKKINHDTTFDESDESEDEKELDTSKEVPPDSEEEKNDAFVFIPKKKQTSPNTLGRKKKSNDYKDALESVSVIIVDPDEVTGDRATGLVIIPRGFMMDKWMSNPFYLDRTDPIKIDYLDALGCVPWCMNGAKDKTGELISKTFNEKQYAYKALVILTDGVPAEEDIVKLVNETVAPEIWNSYLRDSYSVRKKRGEEKNLPTMIGQGRDHMWKVSSGAMPFGYQKKSSALEIAWATED